LIRAALTPCPFPDGRGELLLQPHGGFRPVKVTYVWEEDSVERRDIHIAATPQDSYKMVCRAQPVMKSIALELP